MAQPHDRQIRVFISSTFRDMVEEREQLMSHTWPALRQLCRERQVEFVEVDLRWGIPEAQSTRDETLKICLQEIQACRPYFIALVGERYGWIPGPEALTPDLLEEEPWLKKYQGKSVAELEILQGLLRNPNPGRAFMYLRDPAYAQAKGPDYLPEDATHDARQRDLKTLIRQTCATQKIPLCEDYPDPRRVAELVLQDLQAVIDADYPKDTILDPLTKEARDHEAFAESRCRTYIGRTDYFETLDRHSMDNGGPLVLLGESGSGKSALLANWVAQWRETHPHDLIIQHYIGSTPDSADHWGLMRRLLEEIKRWTEDPEAVPSSHDDLLKIFPVWLAKAKSKAERTNVRCLLILDALNQLEDRDHARLLGWLPAHSFAGPLRLLTSTLPGETMQAVTQRGWASLTIEPFTTDERGRMIAAYLKRVGKTLDDRRIAWLATAPQTANPLYLKILLDDLRVTGTHERLDERLNGYLAAPDIPSLLTLVLARYQRDYERDRPGLVSDTLSLIRAARRGLSETELRELLKPPDQPQLPQAIWAPLRAAMEDLLVDCGGILNVAHDYLRTAVASAFVPDNDIVKEYRLRLADFFEGQPVSARNCDELPWLLWQIDARARLRACLLDLDRFLTIHQRDKDELMAYWVGLKEERTMGPAYLASFEHWTGYEAHVPDQIAYAANRVAIFLLAAALYREAAPLYERALAIREQALGPTHPDVATSCNNLALLYTYQGAYAKAEPLAARAVAISEQARGPTHPDVATPLNNLALLYTHQGAYAKAEPLHTRALAIREQALGPAHPDVAQSLHNLAALYDEQGAYGKAEPLYARALAISEQARGPAHPEVAQSLHNLAALYDHQGTYTKAEPLYERALAIWEQTLGPTHPLVATSLTSLAALYDHQGTYTKAEPLCERALAIREQALGPAHPEVAQSLHNLAALYDHQGTYTKAEPLYERALAIWEQALGPADPDVATSLTDLARLYRAQGAYAKAEPLYERALAIREQALGLTHPEVATSLTDLARLYRAQGAYSKAKPLYARAVKILRLSHRSTGHPHPDFKTIQDNYNRLLQHKAGT